MTFFEKYSFKQKNYALALFSILLIAVSYKKAFNVSIETRIVRDELRLKLEKAATANSEIKIKQIELAQLNRYLGEENNTVEKVQQGFLNFFARNAEGLAVYEIQGVLNYKHPDFEINTHRIILKGGFLESLSFIYKLEKNFSLGKILNVKYEHKRYSYEDTKNLYTILLIQNYLK